MKLELVSDLSNYNKKNKVVNLLQDFLKTGAGSKLRDFARYDLIEDYGYNTFAFATLVKSSRALILLSTGDFYGAFKILDCLSKSLASRIE